MDWLRLAPWLGVLAVGAAWDIAARRIPNAVSLLTAAAGIVLAAAHGGVAVLSGLAAMVAIVALLWWPWTRGHIGGGDVKLGAAAAVQVGMMGLPQYLLCTALAGGVVAAVCFVASSRGARAEMRGNIAAAALGHTLDLPARPAKADGRVSVPYGVAFAVGAVATLWWRA